MIDLFSKKEEINYQHKWNVNEKFFALNFSKAEDLKLCKSQLKSTPPR